ncbi:transposable element Tcb1 transposase [Trichonephila clavipes]|nr:transposable element Tcb1 transposase [Trichonephila clavipes]
MYRAHCLIGRCPAQAAPTLWAPVSSRTIPRRLAEGHLNQVFSDECKFNLSSDENQVRVWRPLGERLNPAFALQRHTSPTAGVMVWGTIVYDTRAPRSHFPTRQCSATHSKNVTSPPPPHYYPYLACSIPRFVTNHAHLESFGTASWTAYEFGRTRDAFTVTVERNISGHHTEPAQRYQANGSHCEFMAILTSPKPIPKVNLVPRPKHNTAFVGFTRVNNQGEGGPPKCLGGPPVDRDRRSAHPGCRSCLVISQYTGS